MQSLSSVPHTHRSSHLWFPVVTPCFIVNACQCISISFTALLSSHLHWGRSRCGAHSELKTEESFGFGLCGPASQQEMAAFERRHKDPELHKGENSDRSMALYYNSFRWKRLKAGLHTPVPNTAPFIVTRYLAVILRWQRPLLQPRPLYVPQPERESTTRSKWKKHMWHVKWEGEETERERERKREQSFSYGKCFSYKSFFLTSSPCLLLECSIFKKWLLFHVSSLSVQKGERRIDRQTESGG